MLRTYSTHHTHLHLLDCRVAVRWWGGQDRGVKRQGANNNKLSSGCAVRLADRRHLQVGCVRSGSRVVTIPDHTPRSTLLRLLVGAGRPSTGDPERPKFHAVKHQFTVPLFAAPHHVTSQPFPSFNHLSPISNHSEQSTDLRRCGYMIFSPTCAVSKYAKFWYAKVLRRVPCLGQAFHRLEMIGQCWLGFE